MSTVSKRSPEQAAAVGLDPPAPLFPASEDTVTLKPLRELSEGLKAAFPSPWSEEPEWIVGKVRETPSGPVLDIGEDAFGKLALEEGTWKWCGPLSVGPRRTGHGIAKPKSFTKRLLGRTRKTSNRP